jgi:hypothetical protein
MQNFTKNLPEPVIGLLYVFLSIVILLDAMGAIHATLLVIPAAFLGLWYGFILLQGPQTVRNLLERVQINGKRNH